ncbi:2'-5' RNA ligase family protein [Leucobacter sp. CSA1]|uniref:RNA 2',3'-cyclic phosphodiesterase n=1 Tax=Leucobacter chromiisoli TaxID=2796471 RepID=A0A934UVH0_9MICO|nr:2'-5' RNA ligase family protein [Leucobacter chromiisoli]MBK0418937.1 2'-5' RNA ligase family protein [Leucobacter chromiisoli]
MRLFLSLPLPATVAEHLDLAVGAVADAAAWGVGATDGRRGGAERGSESGSGRPAVRWTPREQRHITLAFLGETPGGAVDELTLELRRSLLRLPAPVVRLRGAGVFSGRTLWVGVQEQRGRAHGERGDRLTALMAVCEEAGALFASRGELLAARDRRRAHVTVGRARDRRRGEGILQHCAAALSVYQGPEWTADEVLLVRSELGAGRGGSALHETLAEIPLSGAAGEARATGETGGDGRGKSDG